MFTAIGIACFVGLFLPMLADHKTAVRKNAKKSIDTAAAGR
jgi:hypothetical protein